MHWSVEEFVYTSWWSGTCRKELSRENDFSHKEYTDYDVPDVIKVSWNEARNRASKEILLRHAADVETMNDGVFVSIRLGEFSTVASLYLQKRFSDGNEENAHYIT